MTSSHIGYIIRHMIDIKEVKRDYKAFQIAVPLSKDELKELNDYCEIGGFKKGALVRKAILEYLRKMEGKNDS